MGSTSPIERLLSVVANLHSNFLFFSNSVAAPIKPCSRLRLFRPLTRLFFSFPGQPAIPLRQNVVELFEFKVRKK